MARLWTSILNLLVIVRSVYGDDDVLFKEIKPPKPQPHGHSEQTKQQMNSILVTMMETYNRHEIPRVQSVIDGNGKVNKSIEIPPLLVDVNMYVYSFSSISVVDMDYTIDFILRQRWQDSRLKFLAPENGKSEPISYLKDHLWLPDLFFRNAKNGFLHIITKPNYLIWLDSNGIITFSQKLSLKVSCHMTLENFPMDTQSCKVNIGSYGYAIDYLDFRWWRGEIYMPTDGLPTNASAKKAIEIRSDLEMNEFTLINYDAYYCAMQYSSTGQFSCLEVKFDLQRRFGFYLIYAYLPSMLIVVIAWVSFLLDSSAVPARVSIGLLCVLALITQSAAILTQLPRVSYVKAIDIWVFICLAFVVSSLLEFAAVNTISRRQNRYKEKMFGVKYDLQIETFFSVLTALMHTNDQTRRKISTGEAQQECGTIDDIDIHRNLNSGEAINQTESGNVTNENKRDTEIPLKLVGYGGVNILEEGPRQCFTGVHRLDFVFAIGYPILFLLFNMAYWTYYLLYKSINIST